MFSFWEKNSFIKAPDVIIVGSGIVGLNAGIALKKKSPALHVLIIDGGMLPYGASTRNAGFACFGSPSELMGDLQKSSWEDVLTLLEKRWKGLLALRNLLGDRGIHYEPLGGYEVFREGDETLYEQCMDFLPELNQRLRDITGKIETYRSAGSLIGEFGFQGINHLIRNEYEGQLDTGEMMRALLNKAKESGVEILHGARISAIEDGAESASVTLHNPMSTGTDDRKFRLEGKRILICLNGFAGKFLPGLDIQPARAQVLITRPILGLKVKGTFHLDHGYYYFRNVGTRLLLGGGRNLNFDGETTETFGITRQIQQHLERLLKSFILPKHSFEIDMRWSGIMGIGENKRPIVQQAGQRIFCAVRMGGMGVAIGAVVGSEAAELLSKSTD